MFILSYKVCFDSTKFQKYLKGLFAQGKNFWNAIVKPKSRPLPPKKLKFDIWLDF